MASLSNLKQQAERARLKAEALEESDRADHLKREAAQAEKRSRELNEKANESTTEEIIGGIFVLALIVGGVMWFFN